MTRRHRRTLFLIALVALGLVVAIEIARPDLIPWIGGSASALEREDAPIRVSRPELAARASLTPRRAWDIARAAAPGAVPAHGTLTELGGRLVYVLAFDRDGRPAGEVILDAATGAILHDPGIARSPR